MIKHIVAMLSMMIALTAQAFAEDGNKPKSATKGVGTDEPSHSSKKPGIIKSESLSNTHKPNPDSKHGVVDNTPNKKEASGAKQAADDAPASSQ